MKKIKKELRSKNYSSSRKYLKLMILFITFIFSFESNGYCLRVPIGIDYKRVHRTADILSDGSVVKYNINDVSLVDIVGAIHMFREKVMTPDRIRYLLGIYRMVNSNNELKNALSIGTAADVFNFYYVTNAEVAYWVDENELAFHSGEVLEYDDPQYTLDINYYKISMADSMKRYIETKALSTGSSSSTKMMHQEIGKGLSLHIPGLPKQMTIFRGNLLAPLLLELFAIGVDEISIIEESSRDLKKWRIEFWWQHPNGEKPIHRTLYYIHANALEYTGTDDPPLFLQAVQHPIKIYLEKGFDPSIFYKKAVQVLHDHIRRLLEPNSTIVANRKGSQAWGIEALTFRETLNIGEKYGYEEIAKNVDVLEMEERGLEFGYGPVEVMSQTELISGFNTEAPRSCL